MFGFWRGGEFVLRSLLLGCFGGVCSLLFMIAVVSCGLVGLGGCVCFVILGFRTVWGFGEIRCLGGLGGMCFWVLRVLGVLVGCSFG